MQRLAEPLAIVSASGEMLEVNSAFQALVNGSGDVRLASLFGPGVADLLVAAMADGHSRAFVPLQSSEARVWYRLSLTAVADRQEVIALATPMKEEMAWRRLVEERNRELSMLRDVGAALSGTVELTQLTERIYQQTAVITQSGNFYVALYDRDCETLSFPRYVENGVWQELTSRPFSNGLTEYILRTKQPLLLNRNVIEEATARGIEPIGRPCCAWIGVPMMAGGEPIGVIGLQDYERTNVYDEHDLELLGIIAGQAAAAIKNARLLASARRAYDELSEAQARLLETERVRSVTETVGALNHEINNPLAVIAGNAQLLMRRSDPMPAEVRAKIDNIYLAADRIQRVTKKMATLIQATSMPYPGESTILDIRRSVARNEVAEEGALPGARPVGDAS